MPDNSNKSFDKEFENLAWEKMNALLDRELPVRKRRLLPVWFWWTGIAAVMIFAAGLWYHFDYKADRVNENNTLIALENKSATQPYVKVIECIDDLLAVHNEYFTNKAQKITRSQDHKIAGSQDDSITRSQDHKITRSQNEKLASQDHKITRSQDHKIKASKDDSITGSQNEKLASQDHSITRSQHLKITASQDHSITRSQDKKITRSKDEIPLQAFTFTDNLPILTTEITLLHTERSDSSLFIIEPFKKKQSRFFINTGILVDNQLNGYGVGAGMEFDLSSKWTIGFALQHDKYNLSFEALTENPGTVSTERDTLGINTSPGVNTSSGTAAQVILPKQELAVNTFGLQVLSAYKVSSRFALNTGIGLDYRFVRQRSLDMEEALQSDPNNFNLDLEANRLDSNEGINEFVNFFDIKVSVGTSYLLSARWSLEASYRRGFSSLFRELDYPHKRSQLFLGMKYSF